MNRARGPNHEATAAAEAKLARLGVRVQAMQSVLVRLLQDVVRAESRVDADRAAQLVEANEQLVVSALASQAEAEATAKALQLATQSTVLDALTQLPTRTTLVHRFEQAAAHAKRHGSRFAVLFLDLDEFKSLNDEHGHAFGDLVLRRVAERLVSAVREEDTVSRHGGDEFVILLAELGQPGDALAVAEKLIAAVGAPAELAGRVVISTASVGVAIYPDDGADVDTLIARADAAMYEAKRRGAGGVAYHTIGPIADPGPEASGAAPQRRRSPGQAAAEEQRLADLREANEKLVLAAISAQELQAAAEQSQRRHTALLAAVADELRNPSAPIRIAAEMLGLQPAEQRLYPRVQAILDEQTAAMARLVGNLAEASNAEHGRLALDRQRVDMAAVIDRAVAAFEPLMDLRGQTFEVLRPPGRLDVDGDAARLEQIVGNLLDNASKHTHDGGRISLEVVVGEQTLAIAVSDDGIGINAQMLPHVFAPFVQETRALGLHGVGLGIGLTVARTLARAHGGSLVAHSEGTDRGSRFVLTLPLSPPPPPGPAQADGSAAGGTVTGS